MASKGVGGTLMVSGTGSTADEMSVIGYLVFNELRLFI